MLLCTCLLQAGPGPHLLTDHCSRCSVPVAAPLQAVQPAEHAAAPRTQEWHSFAAMQPALRTSWRTFSRILAMAGDTDEACSLLGQPVKGMLLVSSIAACS